MLVNKDVALQNPPQPTRTKRKRRAYISSFRVKQYRYPSSNNNTAPRKHKPGFDNKCFPIKAGEIEPSTPHPSKMDSISPKMKHRNRVLLEVRDYFRRDTAIEERLMAYTQQLRVDA